MRRGPFPRPCTRTRIPTATMFTTMHTAIPNPRWAVAYLLVFGLGTVGGMMLITLSIASAFSFLGKGRQKFSHRLGLVSGLLSLAFGILLVYQIGFAGGLFTSHPHWTPR